MNYFAPPEMLRHHRPLLLACEAIGLVHMAGKARVEFLQRQSDEKVDYDYKRWHDYEQPPFPWDGLLDWVKQFPNSSIPPNAWPSSIKEFTEKHTDHGNNGLLGLLQAGHAMASGIEKNLPRKTSEYLKQLLPHMWLSSSFGHPKRNLFRDPPVVLTERGWRELVAQIRRVLEKLRSLALGGASEPSLWAEWREQVIGSSSYIRQVFLSTLAETRLPNNDVTLWDQSYVAAALFKSAVAGALLDNNFPWNDGPIKQKIRWRLLTIAIGSEHYEARAVKIGDWTGTQAVLEDFFHRVSHLIEEDLAVGSLLYRDSSVAVFSFPGERFDESVPAPWLNVDGWVTWLQAEVDRIAQELELETPPLVRLSTPTRSLVPLVRERREVYKKIAIPLHRSWYVRWSVPGGISGHVCPVCQMRPNGDPTTKNKPCRVCQERRHHRLDDWLNGRLGYDTIWLEEVADRNDRIAILTFSLDLEPWLEGERVDSLRAQAISEWARFNPVLSELPNPIRPTDFMDKLVTQIKERLRNPNGELFFNEKDLLLANLQDGYVHVPRINPKNPKESEKNYKERLWRIFFRDIVEDRTDAPDWDSLTDDERAAWLTHQLFRKLPSPGRLYRFWREAEEFFEELLKAFRQIAARNDNPWRGRRLFILPEPNQSDSRWKDRTIYNGRWRELPFSLVYVQALKGFVTVSNLAHLLSPEESKAPLQNQHIFLEEEDVVGKVKKLVIGEVKEVYGNYSHLGTYHPVIPLNVSPLCFRVVVPLEAASECVDLAVTWWKEQFARVGDRLPLRIGLVAFGRTQSFQAIMEAVRNLEQSLIEGAEEEVWQVERHDESHEVVALQLRRKDGHATLWTIPTSMPDGRKDVFYPYVQVKDQQLRYPKDFRHPNGRVYRHVSDLRIGDSVTVVPARIITLFMDSIGTRFEISDSRYIEDWKAMREVWELLKRIAPSQTALQRFRSALDWLEQEWRSSPDQPSPDLWRDTLRALLARHLELKGAVLETLTGAASNGLLQWALEWHMTALKETV